MTRRLENHLDDPMEELLEVYQDVKEIEANLGKALNIGSKCMFKFILLDFIIAKNKEMFQCNIEL